jgi:hypothetical protein
MRINEAKYSSKRQKKLRKQINGKLNNIGSADENKYKYVTAAISFCQKQKSRASFIQLKPIFDIFLRSFSLSEGRAVAQAVGRWLPTAAARVRVRAVHVVFVVDKAALEQVFYEYFGLPCQSSFHQLLHHHNHPGLTQ